MLPSAFTASWIMHVLLCPSRLSDVTDVLAAQWLMNGGALQEAGLTGNSISSCMLRAMLHESKVMES